MTDNNPQGMNATRIFDVVVTLSIGQNGKEVETRKIDFGKVRDDQLKALTDLFATISSNVDAIRKMAPIYEKLDKSKPSYLR
ncbi:MAG: hypothetical protein ACRECH_08155 [Nitrososphaerales archaeon]